MKTALFALFISSTIHVPRRWEGTHILHVTSHFTKPTQTHVNDVATSLLSQEPNPDDPLNKGEISNVAIELGSFR